MARVDATTTRNDDPSSVAPELRTQESFSSSVVAVEDPESYDPLARALNTLQFGLLVHFGTTTALSWSSSSWSSSWSSPSSCAPNDRLGWASILLLHEYWVYLQHFNVLANPLCQRLDRQYGIALLRRNRHWAIAGTLSAYWCRESVCLFLCLPFCASPVVRYLVVYSLAYHTIKSRGVRSDALRRSSPTLGIMRVVIDRFYTNDATERAVSMFRLLLQGTDTAIHYAVVRELWYRTNPETHRAVHALFVAWTVHAALNQYFRRSTASLMVEAWNNATVTPSPSSSEKSDRRPERRPSLVRSSVSMIGEEERKSLLREDGDGDEDDDDAPSSDDEDDLVDEHYVVRSLLRPGRVSDDLKGRCGTASNGVDAAVRVETVVAVVATLYVVGLGDAPLRLTATATTTMSELVGSAATEIATKDPWFALCYAWTLTALLHSAGTVAFAKRRRESGEDGGRSNHHHRRRDNTSLLLTTMDVAVTTWGGVFSAHSRNDDGDLLSAALASLIVVRSFLFASRAAVGRRRRPDGRRPLGPRISTYLARIAEFYVRLRLARTLLVEDRRPTIDAVGALVSVAWACVASSRDAKETLPGPPSRPPPPPPPPDVVFLGHPGALSDFWALWSSPYPMDDRWRAGPRWLFDGLLWPLHYLLSCYSCVARRRLLGDAHAHYECDENAYAATDHRDDVVRVATWSSNHFGRHFATRPEEVRRNVAASARRADALGARVLCLGALNKAERINGGGVGVVRDLGPERRVAVVHGNHLTAAAVVETTTRLLGGSSSSSVAEKRRIFLTGASSKVGWAVARWLRARGGHDVLCHSTDAGRRRYFEKEGFEAASSLHEGAAFSKLWIVGKGDPGVADAIPHGAVAVCFSVPSPPRLRETRPDVRVVEAGTLHADPCRFDPPRSFANKLREHEMFACHAAGVVAAYEMRHGRRSRDEIDEIGPVDPDVLEDRLRAAEAIGFRVPSVTPIVSSRRRDEKQELASARPDVLVVGAGPSGLATAAALRRRGVSCAILERRTEPDAFGSWDAHFSPLTVTTRRRWCSLPGFSMETWDSRRGAGTDKVDAPTYLRYLRAYATRFDLDVRRGFDCEDVRRNPRTGDWILEGADGTSATAPHVVVATGRNGAPRRDTDDGVGDQLRSAGVDVLHSTDLRTEKDWTKVAAAARDGALLVVGLGNSAADVLTEVLGRCEKQRTDATTSTTMNTVVAPLVHVSVRTVPPVFPFAHGPLRVDAVGAVLRRAPRSVRRGATALLRRYLPSTVACDRAFPSRLPRWDRVDGDRVPVVDKEGRVAEALASGAVVGRGPVAGTTEDGRVSFEDGIVAPVRVSTAVLATGYRRTAPLEREDPLNGVHAVGLFGDVGYLPLTALGEEAEAVAARIAEATAERENHAATTSQDDRR